ncbi:NAD-dependent protein deacetylase (Regulatory protein SIR2 homolog) [Durusdinium trenchii]|uniref:NAD-dependent protein deacetylase (Regulatory protein SIR2 homolog) n=1 Tax=Durusdinium trenchii TaxID=1381693 RepID=A0ABP0MTI9_9DINO
MSDIEHAKRLVDESSRIVVLTGAGISTDSGIPDFRGPEGLWTKNPGAEEASDISVFLTDENARRGFWGMMRMMHQAAIKPNEGHHALVRLEERGKLLLLVTQNVDGLHQAAGSSPDAVVEVHGNTQESCCLSCSERRPIEEALEEELPCCQSCGGLLKANVVLFGEALPPMAMPLAMEAAHGCDLMLCVGSTLSVYPVASIVPEAKESGAKLLILNKGPTEYDELADVRLEGSISELLPQICGAHSDSKL